MSIIPDHHIRLLIEERGLISEPHKIGSCSADVRVGDHCILHNSTGVTEHNLAAGSITLQPGDFALVAMHERVRIPRNLCCHLFLKSSRAREGWDHSLAMFVDAGFGMDKPDGAVLTMEVRNSLPRTVWWMRFINWARGRTPEPNALPLYHLLPIGQLVFHKLDSFPDRDYQVHGRYKGALTDKAQRSIDADS